MAWSNEEISQFQIDNNKALSEINATLQPDKDLSGKVGVFAPGQMGDLMTVMSILKYRKEFFGNKQIIWFANSPNAEALKYAPLSEVRPWPWAGNGLPEGTPDFFPMLCNENNKLNLELAKDYELTKDLDEGYFPVAWMVSGEKRAGIDYPNVSRKVFGVPDIYEWHPYLSFSDSECDMVDEFIIGLGKGKKILLETFAGSGQSSLDEEMISQAINICNEFWGDCIFIFASHKFLRGNETFPTYLFEQKNVVSAANFTVRQCALIADQCDLILSVSSGITVAASCWWSFQTDILQFTGSWICSTKSLAAGRFELVTADNKPLVESKQEYYTKLKELLNERMPQNAGSNK